MTRQQWGQIVSAVFVGIVAAAGFCVLVVRLYPVLWMLGVALLIAYVLDPLLSRLQKSGWTRAQAVWFVLLSAVLLFSILAAVVVPQLVGQAQRAAHNWNDYSQRAQAIFENYRAQLEAYIQAHYPGISIAPFLDEKIAQFNEWFAGALPTALTWLSKQLVSSVLVIGVALLVTLMTFHFMMVLEPFRRTIANLFGSGRQTVRELDREVTAMLGQYVRGLVTTCATIAVVTAILLTIVGFVFGTDYGLLIGLLAGVSYVIPLVGPGSAGVLAAFLGYFTADHHAVLAMIVSAFVIWLTNQMGDLLLMPNIVGRRVGLHPLVIITALLCAFKLWGVGGMLIATPTAASLKIILARWLPIQGVEHGAPPPKDKPLLLDVGAAIGKAYSAATNATHKMGNILLGGEGGEQHPTAEGSESSQPEDEQVDD